MVYYYHPNSEDAAAELGTQILAFLNHYNAFSGPIILMCIGSDRSTGDSLGPLVGYKLSQYEFQNVYVYGSLSNPINATNLHHSLLFINKIHNNPFIIAIDASLGVAEHVGMITLSDGPLRPGLGVKKELPKVGNLHITGIVNTAYSQDRTLLQTTRLSVVMSLVDTITAGFIEALYPKELNFSYKNQLFL